MTRTLPGQIVEPETDAESGALGFGAKADQVITAPTGDRLDRDGQLSLSRQACRPIHAISDPPTKILRIAFPMGYPDFLLFIPNSMRRIFTRLTKDSYIATMIAKETIDITKNLVPTPLPH